MSTKLTGYVWDGCAASGMKLSSVAIMARLADFSNDEGVCWPSIETIARQIGAGMSTVRTATRLPAPTTSAVMQNAAVGQSTTPAQSTGWPSVTHPALNNAPAVKNTVDLPTWEELTDIRDTLNTAIDKELSRTTSDVLFLALRRVKADLNADINTRLEQSARIIQRTPDEVLPALVLAATWFDNAARDADIIRRNAITHPGFVPVIPLKVPVQ